MNFEYRNVSSEDAAANVQTFRTQVFVWSGLSVFFIVFFIFTVRRIVQRISTNIKERPGSAATAPAD